MTKADAVFMLVVSGISVAMAVSGLILFYLAKSLNEETRAATAIRDDERARRNKKRSESR